MLRKYLLVTGTNLVARSAPIFAAALMAHQHTLPQFGAYAMLYGYVQFACFIGSIGSISSWQVLATLTDESSKLQRSLLVIAIIGPILLGTAAYSFGLPSDIIPTDDSHFQFGFAVACFCAATSVVTWAAADAIARRDLKIHLALNSLPSAIWPAAIAYIGSFNGFIDIIPLVSFALIATGILSRWHSLLRAFHVHDHTCRDEVSPPSRKVVLALSCGFIGSASSQAAAYFLALTLAGIQGSVSATMGTFAIAMQFRQAILFLPASISNVLLRDLLDKATDQAFVARLFVLHKYLSLILASGIAVCVAIVMQFGSSMGIAVNQLDLLVLAAIPASAVIVVTNNLYSRLFLATERYTTSMFSDFVFAIILSLIALYCIPRYGLFGAASAMAVAAIAQRLFQVTAMKTRRR